MDYTKRVIRSKKIIIIIKKKKIDNLKICRECRINYVAIKLLRILFKNENSITIKRRALLKYKGNS